MSLSYTPHVANTSYYSYPPAFQNVIQTDIVVGRKAAILPRDNEVRKPDNVTDSSKRLFAYISPFQALALYGTGAVTSLASQWFAKGLLQPDNAIMSLARFKKAAHLPAEQLERQTAIYFQKGLESVVMMALKYKPLQTRLKAYLGASVLGYALASMSQGVQEVWIRREETQIRAHLLQQLQGTFKQSLEKKHSADNTLRQWTLKQIQDKLLPAGLSLNTLNNNDVSQNKYWRFPYEPTHFTFGDSGNNQNTKNMMSSDSFAQPVLSKLAMLGLGFASGWLYVGLNQLISSAHERKIMPTASSKAKQTLMEITNAMDREALFLVGNKKVLWVVLALSAAAKAGKLLMDGYREIEVTRRHADTELKYQTHNWLDLDPSFRSMTEQAAVNNALSRLDVLITGYNIGQVPASAVQYLAANTLANIGRESAPKYFQMTPGVNLAPARG